MKNLINKKWFEWLLLAAPFAMWFSYFPNIHFGRFSGMNFELSIAVIYVAILAICGLPLIFLNLKKIPKHKLVVFFGLFVVWNFLSLIWSMNRLRSLMTAGLWSVLWVILASITVGCDLKKLWPTFKKNLITSSLIMSALAIFQVGYGAFSDWGLCAGCLAHGFGFVRPSGMAIEPQFFGSLLIAPLFVLADEISRDRKNSPWQFLVVAIALYLTLSRGAIFAVVAAMLFLFFSINKIQIKKLLKINLILVAGFILGMFWHGIFTELNPRIGDGLGDSIAKSVNQMSLGKVSINLPRGKIFRRPVKKISSPENPTQPKAIFDGYVEKSTSERTNLNNLAIKTWSSNWQRLFFGVGSGAAGRAIFTSHPQIGWEFEIVQNEFLSILLELGLVGLSLFLAAIAIIAQKIFKNRFWLSILIAYLIQWNFFSGLPNALHIYLMMFFAAISLDDSIEVKVNS